MPFITLMVLWWWIAQSKIWGMCSVWCHYSSLENFILLCLKNCKYFFMCKNKVVLCFEEGLFREEKYRHRKLFGNIGWLAPVPLTTNFLLRIHIYMTLKVEIFFRRKQSNWLPHTLAKPSDEIFGKKNQIVPYVVLIVRSMQKEKFTCKWEI